MRVRPKRSRKVNVVPIQDRTTRRVAPSDLGDEAPMEERAEDVVAVDAADALDLAPGAWLPVGDHRQRLERRRRQACLLAGRVGGEPCPDARRGGELPRVILALEPDPALTGLELVGKVAERTLRLQRGTPPSCASSAVVSGRSAMKRTASKYACELARFERTLTRQGLVLARRRALVAHDPASATAWRVIGPNSSSWLAAPGGGARARARREA